MPIEFKPWDPSTMSLRRGTRVRRADGQVGCIEGIFGDNVQVLVEWLTQPLTRAWQDTAELMYRTDDVLTAAALEADQQKLVAANVELVESGSAARAASIVAYLRRRAEHFETQAADRVDLGTLGRVEANSRAAVDRMRVAASNLRSAAAEIERGDDLLPPI